jgi:hypothetical protein
MHFFSRFFFRLCSSLARFALRPENVPNSPHIHPGPYFLLIPTRAAGLKGATLGHSTSYVYHNACNLCVGAPRPGSVLPPSGFQSYVITLTKISSVCIHMRMLRKDVWLTFTAIISEPMTWRRVGYLSHFFVP